MITEPFILLNGLLFIPKIIGYNNRANEKIHKKIPQT